MTAMNGEKTFACLLCSKRKIKCDKARPICSTCARLKHECVYQAPEPPKKRRKLADTAQRLEQCESLLAKHGLLDKVPSASPPTEPPALSSNGEHVLHNRNQNDPTSRFVESTFWSSLNATHEAMVSDEYDVGGGQSRPRSLFTAAVLGHPPINQDISKYRPSSQEVRQLWEIFCDRIDPITKILHIPTTSVLIEKAIGNHSALSKSEECICFAVYFISISALNESECKAMLGKERSVLAAQYVDALQYALLNANLLRTTNLQVLQAFVLFLIVIRGRFDAQLFWIMTGVAIRIAQRMGMHRDGARTGVPPFETEQYRRLFWQLPSLDGFAGQFAGTGLALDALRWDTKQPLNVNDADIWPGMTEVTERKEATDMIFYLAKSLFVEFYKELILDLQLLEQAAADKDVTQQNETDKKIDQIEDLLEVRLLRYCDPMEPLHLNVSLLARVAVMCARFRIRMPRIKAGLMTADESQQQCDLATSIFHRLGAAHTNPMLLKYAWHTRTFIIWDILIWYIGYLTTNPNLKEAWSVLGTFCDSHPDLVSPRQPIAFAIVKFILKAWGGQTGIVQPAMIKRFQLVMSSRDDLTDHATQKFEAMLEAMPAVPAMSTAKPGELDFSTLDLTFDWDFWDQLINDPETMIAEPL